LIDDVDEIKEKLTDGEYKNMVEKIAKLYKECGGESSAWMCVVQERSIGEVFGADAVTECPEIENVNVAFSCFEFEDGKVTRTVDTASVSDIQEFCDKASYPPHVKSWHHTVTTWPCNTKIEIN